ncbi:hypothetical protein F8B43_3817 [Methylorubrum populi]|uniref:Uncharacterized protein n=1 Tax=Methylorubrum populi TaxID=223967 RepID=A0A833J4C9_9HYPH|nr:hypothetical protein F8B43_3817 [Methylorubrum populi]
MDAEQAIQDSCRARADRAALRAIQFFSFRYALQSDATTSHRHGLYF